MANVNVNKANKGNKANVNKPTVVPTPNKAKPPKPPKFPPMEDGVKIVRLLADETAKRLAESDAATNRYNVVGEFAASVHDALFSPSHGIYTVKGGKGHAEGEEAPDWDAIRAVLEGEFPEPEAADDGENGTDDGENGEADF